MMKLSLDDFIEDLHYLKIKTVQIIEFYDDVFTIKIQLIPEEKSEYPTITTEQNW